LLKGIEETTPLLVSMFTVIMVHTEGSLTEKQIPDLEKLYTVCQFRTDANFVCLTSWTKHNVTYQLYGKPKNKNTKLNHYTFPFTQEQYYGNLCLVKKVEDEPQSLTIQEWNQCMNLEPFVEPEALAVPGELTKEEYEDE
jgi:hypothetical protein